MRRLAIGLFCFAVATLSLAQESAPDIKAYLSRVEHGEADAVRAELPALLTQYPNNPGVLYLQGVLTTDGTEAVRVYQSIVDNFPKSEWADDALYKVYQFYYAIGLYRTAEIKLNQLKTDYPQSKYLAQGSQPMAQGLPEEKDSADAPVPDTTTATREESRQAPDERVTAETSTTPLHPAAATTRGAYALQVGAYSQQTNAEKQKLFFEDLGYSVEVINKVQNNRSLFVVLVGEYRTADEARSKGAEISKKYDMHPMVVTR